MDSPATEACTKIGGILPSVQDYEKLVSYFELDSNQFLTNQGRNDFQAIFEGMSFRIFWTSSVDPSDSDGAFGFNGEDGNIVLLGPKNGIWRINSVIDVRCVGH